MPLPEGGTDVYCVSSLSKCLELLILSSESEESNNNSNESEDFALLLATEVGLEVSEIVEVSASREISYKKCSHGSRKYKRLLHRKIPHNTI